MLIRVADQEAPYVCVLTFYVRHGELAAVLRVFDVGACHRSRTLWRVIGGDCRCHPNGSGFPSVI